MRRINVLVTVAALAANVSFHAEPLAAADSARVYQTRDGLIHAGDEVFESWAEYVRSDFFADNGKRCGTRRPAPTGKAAPLGSPGDCTLSITNPSNDYAPQLDRYRITVVVHVIQSTSGDGALSVQQVESQIDILNEDFLALLGSNGEDGTNIEIEFVLAEEDPDGAPSNGITYSTNDVWFDDAGNYWSTLAWDTSRYLNIYTNTADGNLGYVPTLPNGTNIAGQDQDRVVVLWSSFGANGPIGPPYNHGRTTTHEVGHYLGLDHTFGNGCGSAESCYTTGDLLCDTDPQSFPTSGCRNNESCGDPDPFRNYMDYSDDLCMEEFTAEQARRMRCTLLNYRPGLLTIVPSDCGNGVIDPGEDCDDGNRLVGDGCDAFCIVEGNNCCDVGHGTGCTSGSIEECLCAIDSYCCDTEWDDLCVASVDEYGCGQCDVDGLPLEVSSPDATAPLRFTSSLILSWNADDRTGADLFNLYRGTLDGVTVGAYGSCLYAGLSNNGAVDPADPPAGLGYTYLVTGTNGNGEGPLGYATGGGARANLSPCTAARTAAVRQAR